MVRKSLMVMIAGFVVCGLMFTVACSHKEVKPDGGEQGSSQMTSQGSGSDMTSHQTSNQMEEEAIREELQRARESFENEDVHFDFDQSILTPEARGILERKAAWLRRNPEATVTIEGHCDERGTVEYNIALGERRARSAMDFMADLGVRASRMHTVSYGEEQPLDPGHNEAAWAKNRRDHFVIH